jgi:hypothetical protein
MPLPSPDNGEGEVAEGGIMPRDRRSNAKTPTKSMPSGGIEAGPEPVNSSGKCATGTRSGPYLIQWTNNYTGEVVRSGEITSGFCSQEEGWFRFEADGLDQRIILVARPRHFGGAQWYFICPVMNRRASVLWMPPGAERFCSRQTWGGRVIAYRSQFLGPERL